MLPIFSAQRIWRALLRREWCTEVLGGAPDLVAFELRAAEAGGRSLVTENVRDYRPLETALLAEGRHHHGIIYTTDRQFPRGQSQTVGRLVRALDSLLQDPPSLRDRSIFLSPIAEVEG